MLPTDIAAEVIGELAIDPATITAGAGNDGVALNGRIIDLLALAKRYTSAKLVLVWKVTQAGATTLSAALKLQHGAQSNLSDAADYTYAPNGVSPVLATAVVKTGPNAGIYGRTEIALDLSGAKQYIRAVATLDLSAANTDTVAYAAVLVFGGANAPAS
jgi:hypothetical protein